MESRDDNSPGHKIMIRAAQADDSAELAVLADAATRRLTAWLWDQQASEGQSSFEVGREAIRSDATHLSYHKNWDVAELDRSVAGGLNSYKLELPSTAVADHLSLVLNPLTELKAVAEGTWYVSVASVFPEHRGHGIGQALLTHAATKATRAGVSQLTLIVASFNTNALRLYLRVGFEEWQRRPFVPFPGSDPKGDWILMAKDA